MIARHSEWLAKAEDDLRFAEVGLKEEFYAQVCFLSQQSIEKCLKGSLVFLGRTYPKSHSLTELMSLLPELDLKASYREPFAIIDGYYIPLRYPDAMPGMKASGAPNKNEAVSALKIAENVYELVMKFVSPNIK